MGFKKGQSGNPAGRKKGVKNKIPADLRAHVLEVMDELEAQNKGLQAVAEKDPKWFFETFVKALLPKHIEADLQMPMPLTINLRREK